MTDSPSIRPTGDARPTSAARSTDDAKRALRRSFLSRRRLVPPEERRRAGERLAEAFARFGLSRGARTAAAYVSMGTEIDMAPLLGALLDGGTRVLVPRLGTGLDIGWSDLPSLGVLAAPGPRRPGEPADEPVLGPDALRDADLIILPALAVNLDDGTRLGRGGGWYDRALAFRSPGVPLAAVCWPWEAVRDPLPREAHDVPVDAALTPAGVTVIGRVAGATRI